MTSDSMKNYLYKYVVEEKGLKDKISKIKGEKDVKLGDIRRTRINFVKQHSRHFNQASLPVVKEYDRQLLEAGSIEAGKVALQNKCFPNHRILKPELLLNTDQYEGQNAFKSRQEKYAEMKTMPPLRRRSTTYFFPGNNSEFGSKHTADDLHMPEKLPSARDYAISHKMDNNPSVSFENRRSSSGSPVDKHRLLTRRNSEAQFGKNHSKPSEKKKTIFYDMAHRVTSKSTWSYLMKDVFYRLNKKYEKHDPKPKEVDTPSTESYDYRDSSEPYEDDPDALRTCRYLRLPSLSQYTYSDDEDE